MGTHGISSDDLKSVLTHLSEHGYAVIEGVLSEDEIRHYRVLWRSFLNGNDNSPSSRKTGPRCQKMTKSKRI